MQADIVATEDALEREILGIVKHPRPWARRLVQGTGMTHDEPTSLGGLPPLPPPGTTVGRFEVTDGDLVRCGLAPYFFRVRRDGGAMLLEPVGAAEAAALAAAGTLADEHQA